MLKVGDRVRVNIPDPIRGECTIDKVMITREMIRKNGKTARVTRVDEGRQLGAVDLDITGEHYLWPMSALDPEIKPRKVTLGELC